MTEQQQHLANLLEQRDALRSDLEKLQETTGNRRELFFKVQGAIEYLTQIGVELPEPESEAEVAETEVVEEPAPKKKKG
jgi:prefoldin subunit 5